MDTEKKIWHIGDVARFEKHITREDVDTFARVTGDFNELHMDPDYAKTTRFGRCVVHGLLVSNLISTTMGMIMPGKGCIFLDQSERFLLPTYIDDTVTAIVELTGIDEKKSCYIAELTGKVVNQRGETVVTAVAHEMMPKEYFSVEA